MDTDKKILSTPIRISVVVLLFGILSKILHWPLASLVIGIAFSAIFILYLFRFFNKKQKLFLDYTKLVLVVFWCANGFFSLLHLPYQIVVQTIIFLAFLIWTVMEGSTYFSSDSGPKENSPVRIAWNGLVVLGTLALVTGSLFKFFHWKYATVLLVIGFILVMAYILKDTFSQGIPKNE